MPGMTFRTLSLPPLLVLIGALGCQAPQAPVGPTACVIHAADYESLFSQTLTRLRGVEWRMKRVDRERGIIETLPATSAHFPELWRVDSPGAYNYLESSLHTIRRAVTVRIERVDAAAGGTSHDGRASDAAAAIDAMVASDADDATPPGGAAAVAEVEAREVESQLPGTGRYRVEVEVRKERFSTPERQVTTASGTLGLFSEKTPTIYGYFRARPGDVRWIALGRDEVLERNLLDHLLRGHVREPSANVSPPAE